ncbi:mannan endo-1,4-beta-mannosidase [Pedobacter sp. UYP30]|uniref:glycoside hydrolase 5 family protein n=1 Tax=Pedobacter sp. UYP30 TaxID=1756400 RepID=UPI003393A828
MRGYKLKISSIFLLFALCFSVNLNAQSKFVTVKDGQFVNDNKPYTFVGTNYWYGSLLALKGDEGKIRLKKELDFLRKNGVINLRLMLGAEGESDYKYRVANEDALQPKKGVFRDAVLYGLDYLLSEVAKRDMKVVLHFTNTWEWSGGLGEYLEWNGHGKQPLPKNPDYSWDIYRDYISQFYTCDACKANLQKYIKHILAHTNTINNVKYVDDSSIMAWEIINEPRPMRPKAMDAFQQWMSETAALIKSIDKNHLLTTGSEGEIAMDNNTDEFVKLHADKNIDYITIHLWPKNWGWFKGDSIATSFDNIINNADEYIKKHVKIAEELNKPLVIEEFGLPRNKMYFDINSSTSYRDRFYTKVFEFAENNKIIAGTNFWSFGGLARPIPGQVFWKHGDDYMGDPGGEEQGLNSVFTSDKSTWKIIKTHAKKIDKR